MRFSIHIWKISSPLVQKHQQPVLEAVDGLLPVRLVSERSRQRHLLVCAERGREDVRVVFVEIPAHVQNRGEPAVVEAEHMDRLVLDG